jgi:antiviral helicase SKI2
VIVKEGIGGGPTPSIQVFDIGTTSDRRHPSDILPFLPAFRGLCKPLPTDAADRNLKVYRIPLSDVECVTNTMIKISGPIWYLNITKEAVKFAQKELSKIPGSWATPMWDEMDWSRVKELQLRDVLDRRQAQASIAQSCKCLDCPDFLKHVRCSHP